MLTSRLTDKIISSSIYHSQGNRSITSLGQIHDGPTIVYLDEEIGHLQTNEIENINKYYDQQYEFFNQSDEDDVLYAVVDGKEIFRQQHQVETFVSKIDLQPGMCILDYGCAKGTVLKRLTSKFPTIKPYLFDVSQAYVHLWKKFVPEDQYASYIPRPEWKGKIDVITSFFAFEHTADPLKELLSIKDLLKENGLVYMIVPDIFQNTGDFIVADHVHHYSEASLNYLFTKAGFELVEIDSKSHFGAYIVIGKKTNNISLPFIVDKQTIEKITTEYKKIADYWNSLQSAIRNFEKTSGNEDVAIYGAGVYGNFILSSLVNTDNVKYFIDQNSLLHNKDVLSKVVLHPDELPANIKTVYVGLNPRIAQEAIAGIKKWEDREINFFYL